MLLERLRMAFDPKLRAQHEGLPTYALEKVVADFLSFSAQNYMHEPYLKGTDSQRGLLKFSKWTTHLGTRLQRVSPCKDERDHVHVYFKRQEGSAYQLGVHCTWSRGRERAVRFDIEGVCEGRPVEGITALVPATPFVNPEQVHAMLGCDGASNARLWDRRAYVERRHWWGGLSSQQFFHVGHFASDSKNYEVYFGNTAQQYRTKPLFEVEERSV